MSRRDELREQALKKLQDPRCSCTTGTSTTATAITAAST